MTETPSRHVPCATLTVSPGRASLTASWMRGKHERLPLQTLSVRNGPFGLPGEPLGLAGGGESAAPAAGAMIRVAATAMAAAAMRWDTELLLLDEVPPRHPGILMREDVA